MIRFTEKGIFADTEEERADFYTRMDEGDPLVIARLDRWLKDLEIADKEAKDG